MIVRHIFLDKEANKKILNFLFKRNHGSDLSSLTRYNTTITQLR